MTALDHRPDLEPTNADAPPDDHRTRRPVDGVTVIILLAGLVPVVGYAVMGHWPQGDVAVGVLFVLFASWQLARHLGRRR